MQGLLKPRALRGLGSFDDPMVLSLPLSSLKGVTAAHLRSLRQHGRFDTIKDLIEAPVARDLKLDWDWAATIQAIICGLFDKGPPCDWAMDFNLAPHSEFLSRPQTFRTEFGPVFYRGRLNGKARVLVVGQDPSTDEILSQRVLVGNAGQRTQWFLNRVGLRSSYLMLNAFLYSVQNVGNDVLDPANMIQPIKLYRERLFDAAKARNKLQAILCFGRHAQKAVEAWPGRGSIPLFKLMHPTAPDESAVASSWSGQVGGILGAISPDSGMTPNSASFSSVGSTDIPRSDLPFGIPDWHGRGGATLSQRQGANAILWTRP